jgi:hypothetical protein
VHLRRVALTQVLGGGNERIETLQDPLDRAETVTKILIHPGSARVVVPHRLVNVLVMADGVFEAGAETATFRAGRIASLLSGRWA